MIEDKSIVPISGRELDAYINLFSRCYEIEHERTPEDQRGVVSYNDALVIEALRLGGPTGLPRGIYPGELVATVFDKAATERRSKPTISQEEKQYLSDIWTLKQRLKECKNPSRLIVELFAYDYPNSTGVGNILIDMDTGKGYELDDMGAHKADVDLLLSMMKHKNTISPVEHEMLVGQLSKGKLLHGLYLINHDNWDLTYGIKTKIVRLYSVACPGYYSEELERIDQDPLKSCEVLIDFGDYMDVGYEFLKNPPKKEDLTTDQLAKIKEIADEIRKATYDVIAKGKRIADIGRIEKKYIFMSTCPSEVLE